MNKTMCIGIVGAGAVGYFYGLALQRAGLDVMFLARGEHFKAMQAHGLLYESAGVKKQVMVQATGNVACLSGCDVLILTCKTTQLADY